MGKLKGRVAIVTGSSRGIGAATAERLAADGATVAINYARSAAKAEEVADRIRRSGGKAIVIEADVGDWSQAQMLVEKTAKELGRLDILVNNAVQDVGREPIDEINEAFTHQQFAVNVIGPIATIQAAAPLLPQDGGRIINMSSVVATYPVAQSGVYSATKAGLEGMTRAFSVELGPRNITVNAISVGFTDTDLIKTNTEEVNKVLIGMTPLRRIGKLTSIFGVFYYNDDYRGESDTAFSVPGFSATFSTYSAIKSESYSFFTDQTLSITDRLRLQGGIRYNYDSKEATQSLFVGGAPSCPLLTNKRSWDSWTPRVGAQFDATDDVMLYGQWSKGFKSGGFTANSCYDDFDPETIKGPEVGIKTKLFDNRVRFNLAGYYYKISNLQVQKAVDVGTFFVDNAAAAEIYGAEFSLQALIANGLQLDAAGMLQSAKYTSFFNCNEALAVGACGAFDPRPPADRLIDVSGNWLNRAAPYSLNLGLQYEMELGNGGTLLLRGETFFSGKVRYSEFASAEATQPAYNTQNAFITYTTGDDRLTFRGYVKNIGNTDYKISYFYASSSRQGTGNWAAPRTFGVDATLRF